MNAKISSIYLMQNDNGMYWKVTLVDDEGKFLGTFGDDSYCDDINFRKQTFYIMKILNNWDLLKLDNQQKHMPILVDNEFSRINVISNNNGDYLKFDYETGEILSGSGCDISTFISKNISSLISRSGVFMASVTDKYSHRGIVCDMAYLGFLPVYERSIVTEEQEKKGANSFKTFVGGILKLSGVNELIQSNSYPEVSVQFDLDNNIIALGDINENEYLYITENGYELVKSNTKIK